MKETIEGRCVAGHDFGITLRRACPEIKAEHAADRLRGKGHTGTLGSRRQALGQHSRARAQLFEESGRGNRRQRRQSCGHRHRITRQRARLIDRSERCDRLHDVAAPAERAQRHATANDLAESY